MKLVSGSSNKEFANLLAQQLSIPVVDVELSQFSNLEKRIWIKEELQGENVVLVQSFSGQPDEQIVETLLLADALERLGARHVNLVIPWLGYSFQDKVFRPGEPIAAKVVADLVSNAYVKRVFLFDLHNTSIPGFFSLPTHHLSALDLFIHHLNENINLGEAVVVSPDFGGLKRSKILAEQLRLDLVNINKHRDLETGRVEIVDVQGDVHDKICVLMDDAIMSGSTVVEVSKILKNKGAKEVHFFCTHGIFTDNAVSNIQNSDINSVIITNSIQQSNLPDKIKVLDSTPVFAKAIEKWK